ncbi:MAG: sigma-54 dependent transcriptional regulator [Planctomycetota bacterium]
MTHPTTTTGRVLVADDDDFVREHVCEVLKSRGLEPVPAVDGADAIQSLDGSLDAAIVDLDMPGASGLEVLAVAMTKTAGLPVIILSGAGEVADAVAALKRGAFDYITKPFDEEELAARIREALRVSKLQSENATLRASASESAEPVRLIATGEASKRLVALAERCAGVDSTVLITGPSGTGKSVLARWIHQHGQRSAGPFVTVNCGALPRELIESELFGHEKGAFTGAVSSRVGRFEAASRGTLFLDEIGELPLDLQPKLLSAIQDRAVTRLGSTEEVSVDVRLIAATNKDLQEAVSEKAFREDLYYRLNVLTLQVPALRARPEDIIPIAEHTVERIARRLGMPVPSLDASTAAALKAHTWPGNVRELENVLERAMVFSTEDRLRPEDLGTLVASRERLSDDDFVGMTLADLEKRAILATLAAFGGNRGETANALGVSERTIYNRLKEYGRETDDASDTGVAAS